MQDCSPDFISQKRFLPHWGIWHPLTRLLSWTENTARSQNVNGGRMSDKHTLVSAESTAHGLMHRSIPLSFFYTRKESTVAEVWKRLHAWLTAPSLCTCVLTLHLTCCEYISNDCESMCVIAWTIGCNDFYFGAQRSDLQECRVLCGLGVQVTESGTE